MTGIYERVIEDADYNNKKNKLKYLHAFYILNYK